MQGRVPPRPETFQERFAAWLRSLRDAAAAGDRRPGPAPQPRPQERTGGVALGDGLGERIRAVAGPGRLRREVERDHGDPELLRLVDVSGGVVTIDHLMSRWDADFAVDAVGRLQVEETAHRRRETRTYIQLEAPDDLPSLKSWRGLKSIPAAISEVVRDGKGTDKARYYINNLAAEPDAKAFAHANRTHWGIENGCHWTLDVAFREDESRIREKHLRQNMAWLNRFSLPLLIQHLDRKSVAARRRSYGWSDDYLMQDLVG